MKKKAEKTTQSVYIPRLSKNDDSLFVAVNGRRILVKKGETVELPEAFAEVIRNSVRAQMQAESYISLMSGQNG